MLALIASEAVKRPWNVLEWTFIGLLALMTAVVGVFGLFVAVRTVEPRGLRALLRRVSGKA